MENQAVDRIQEKIDLARELGLGNVVNYYQATLEIDELTGMGFKPITEDQIRKKIVPRFCLGRFQPFTIFVGFVSTVITLVVLLLAVVYHLGGDPSMELVVNQIHSWFPHFSSFIATEWIVALGQGFVYYPKMRSKYLEEWHEPIPYGALLACKEAKEKGFGSFRIYYPVKEEMRLKLDPLITASRRNTPYTQYEVFAWDDSKIREA